MLRTLGALTQKKILLKLKCCDEGRHVGSQMVSPYSSVTDMIGEIGWRSLEHRR